MTHAGAIRRTAGMPGLEADDLVMDYTRKTAYRYKEFAPLIRLLDTLQENTTGVGFTF